MASLLALALRALTLLVIVEVAGAGALHRSFAHLQPRWIIVVAGAEVVAYPAYVLIYRCVARLERSATALIVLAGFGPLTMSGGFGVDRTALAAIEGESTARLHVSTVSTLEWVVLAPATAVVAAGLLATSAPVSGWITWPWAVGVPLGIGVAAWALAPVRMPRLLAWRGGRLARMLAGPAAVRTMAAHPRRHVGAWVGVGLYWASEIGAFYAAARTADVRLGIGVAILAYANGYLASRRALPLGGAGVAEALLVYSLHQFHVPLGPAVTSVMIYRLFNFRLAIIPALLAHRGLQRITADRAG